MNVLVIGAAGKTGQLVVDKAVAVGHTVTAFLRDASSYRPHNPEIKVVVGDATDVSQLTAAMAGQSAVIDTVGGKTPYKETDLEQTVAKAILTAMNRTGVRRLVAVSALGVGDSKDQSPFIFEHLLLPTFLRGSTMDKAAMEQAVRSGNVDFVLVRPAILTDHEPTGTVRVVTGEDKAHKITRADTAKFLVDQLTSDQYLGQAVTIANT